MDYSNCIKKVFILFFEGSGVQVKEKKKNLQSEF